MNCRCGIGATTKSSRMLVSGNLAKCQATYDDAVTKVSSIKMEKNGKIFERV